MSGPVKPRRPYNSARRQRQAADTRREILAAAQRLFEERGYATTTITSIAAAAGVAPKTIYVAFETKSGVLRALWNVLLRGDDQDVPVGDREWYRDVLAEPDPARQLELNAHNSRIVKERVAQVLEVIRVAAADPEIGELWSRIQREFHQNQGAIVKSLADRGTLRPELDVSRATDVLWALNHPELWQLLVVQRGWTPDQWERWFAEIACAQLLRR